MENKNKTEKKQWQLQTISSMFYICIYRALCKRVNAFDRPEIVLTAHKCISYKRSRLFFVHFLRRFVMLLFCATLFYYKVFFSRKKPLFLSATLRAKKKRRSKFVNTIISHPITINSWQTFVNIFTAGSNVLMSIFQSNDLVCLLFFVFAVI